MPARNRAKQTTATTRVLFHGLRRCGQVSRMAVTGTSVITIVLSMPSWNFFMMLLTWSLSQSGCVHLIGQETEEFYQNQHEEEQDGPHLRTRYTTDGVRIYLKNHPNAAFCYRFHGHFQNASDVAQHGESAKIDQAGRLTWQSRQQCLWHNFLKLYSFQFVDKCKPKTMISVSRKMLLW